MDIEELRKKYKKSVMSSIPVLERIPTGILAVDLITCGGLPRGRIVEIMGRSSTGKTTIALSIAKEFLDLGKTVLIIDFERTIGDDDLRRVGIDPANPLLIYAQPESGEQGIDLICDGSGAGAELVLVDSVPTMTLSFMDKVNTEDQRKHMAPVAGLFGRNNGRLVQAVSLSNAVCILLNQPRMRSGGAHSYEVSYGGEFFNFTPSIRIKTRRVEDLPDKAGILGTITSSKNKTGPNGIAVDIAIRFATGIDPVFTTLMEGQHYNVIKRGGSNYYVDEQFAPAFPQFVDGLIAKGKDKCIQILSEQPKTVRLLDKAILANFLKSLKAGQVELQSEVEDDGKE